MRLVYKHEKTVNEIEMDYNERKQNGATERRTRCGFIVKVRFKFKNDFRNVLLAIFCIIVNFCANPVVCNRPPKFLIDGQTEIVLRLKEGDETPIGKYRRKYNIIKIFPIIASK